jgi:hypothetical protein
MRKLTAAWHAVPLLIRAPIVAFIVLEIGTTISVLPLVANLKFLPAIWRAASLPILAARDAQRPSGRRSDGRDRSHSLQLRDGPRPPTGSCDLRGCRREVALRGYLQKPLENAYGIVPALLLTGLAFWFAHVPKVTLTHLPLHLIASMMLGFVVYRTSSLLPAMIGHAAGDKLRV